jgi:hypothetical protein
MFAARTLPQELNISTIWLVDKLNFSERLRMIIRYLGLSVNEFSKTVNANQATIAGYLNDGREPGYLFVGKIIKKYQEISPDWLLNGDGEMLRKRNAEIEEGRIIKITTLEREVSMLQKQVGLLEKLVDATEGFAHLREMIINSNAAHKQQIEILSKEVADIGTHIENQLKAAPQKKERAGG